MQADVQKLWFVARRFQALADRIDRLQPQKWLEEDGPRLKKIIGDIMMARLHQKELLSQHGVMSLMAKIEEYSENLTDHDKALIRLMRRQVMAVAALDDEDIVEMEMITAESEQDWLASFDKMEAGGGQAVFEAQIPALEAVFATRGQQTRKTAEKSGLLPSEVLVDEWNPGLRNTDIDRMFDEACETYPALMREAHEKAAGLPPLVDPGRDHPAFTVERQLDFFRMLQETMLSCAGWTEESLKEAGVQLHGPAFLPNPFCWGTRRDIWLTIEHRKNRDFVLSVANTLHETGHLLYLLSLNYLPEKVKDTPLGQVNGYGMHEVIAMFFEQVACRPGFWELLAPMIRAHFGVDGPEWTAENLRAVMNRPFAGKTEWGASELVLMPNMYYRVMAERRIIDGAMSVRDLPQFWAETMTRLTQLPHDAADFYVDESHWLDRQMGYFPAYWMGALCGAKLHALADAQSPLTAKTLEAYLRIFYDTAYDKIMRHAAMDAPMEIIRRELGGAPEDFTALYIEWMIENAFPVKAGLAACTT